MVRFATLLCLAILFGCLNAKAESPASAETTLYVAPAGNDAWSGSLETPNAAKSDGPFATVTGARDAIRRMKAKGALERPVRVLIRAGTYAIKEPLTFTQEDSATLTTPITYAAYPGEKPLISGGRSITNWRQEGDLWVADIPEAKGGAWTFSSLWVDGQRRTPARIPNTGYLKTAGKVTTKDKDGKDVDSNIAFRFTLGDIKPWTDIEDARVVVMHSWETSTHHVASLDEANATVTFTGPAVWPFGQWTGAAQRYYIENVFEGLDQPGEWCLNRKTGKLYYWPMKGERPDKTEVMAPVAKQLLVLQGDPAAGRFIEYLSFQGLGFAYNDYSVAPAGHSDPQAACSIPGAIQAIGARYCNLMDCEVAHVDTQGIWFRLGCQHNRILRNNVHDMGAGGVYIGEGAQGATPEQAAGWNIVDNNWIHRGGRVFPAGCGVWIGQSSYNTVSHNEIHDMYYTGVSVGWSWGYAPSSANHNIIEHNHIHLIGQNILSDMGGIYTLGIAPGTILRNNHIHDVSSFDYGGWGIYPDEGSTDLLIENNVVYDTKTGGFHQHYGRENRVRNNIFAFSRESQLVRSRDEEHVSFFFEGNIVIFNNGKLLGTTYKNGNYRFDRNCYWDLSRPDIEFSKMTFKDWQAKGYDVRSVIADPLFEDAAKRDFRLKSNSPALALGFRPIDANQAGLYGPKKWVNAPKKAEKKEK